jgi:hypothetical protein
VYQTKAGDHITRSLLLTRYRSKDGVRNSGSNTSSSVVNSPIFNNTLYGVRNQLFSSAILATNNW